MAKKRSGPIVSRDLVLHRHIRRFEMDVMMAHELLQLQHALQHGVGRRLGMSGWSIYPITKSVSDLKIKIHPQV